MTHGYDGPIEVGMTFVWEPLLPHATLHVQVTAIHGTIGQDARITTRAWVKHSKVNGAYEGTETWNDESRFREAVMPTGYEDRPYRPADGRYAEGYPLDTATL